MHPVLVSLLYRVRPVLPLWVSIGVALVVLTVPCPAGGRAGFSGVTRGPDFDLALSRSPAPRRRAGV